MIILYRLILGLTVLASGEIGGTTLTNVSLRRLRSATSHGELNRGLRLIEQAQKARVGCEYQLRQNKIPGQCFRLVNYIKNLDVAGDTTSKEFQIFLDERCRVAVSQLVGVKYITRQNVSRDLSPNCQSHLRIRLHELSYIYRGERPAEYFNAKLPLSE